MSNEFIITIKQNGTTLPMVINVSDTFVAKLRKLSDSSVAASPTTSVVSAKNGEIKITFDASSVNALTMEKGDRADYYYSKPVYELLIDCTTVNNGKFVARVDKVYVK